MTEQFSQEYVNYILKAKALQALWVPAVGDWYIDVTFSMVPSLIDNEYTIDRDLVGATWLPTLWQLLGVIEGAGFGQGAEGPLDIIAPDWESPEWYVGDREGKAYVLDKDLMLAAAQLAVRAVEGVENG